MELKKQLKPLKKNIRAITRPKIIGLLSDGEFKFSVSTGRIFKHGATTPYFNYISPYNSEPENESIYFDHFGGHVEIDRGILKSENIQLKNANLKTKSEWLINSINNSISAKIMSTKDGGIKSLLTIKGTLQDPSFENKNSSDLTQQLKN